MTESANHQTDNVGQTSNGLHAMDRTAKGIQVYLNDLIDRKISSEECTASITALLEKEARGKVHGGKVSDETKELIAKQVRAVNDSLIKKTGTENTKDTFFYCVSVMGTGMKYVGGAFVALGAAKWLINAVNEVTSWCKDNVLKQIGGTDLGKKKAVSVTSNIINETLGIMDIANVVLGITLSVGAVLYTAGKKLEEYAPSYDSAIVKMSSEKKEEYKQKLINDIVDELPKERMRFYREDVVRLNTIREDLSKMDPARLAKLKGAMDKFREKVHAKKAQQNIETTKPSLGHKDSQDFEPLHKSSPEDRKVTDTEEISKKHAVAGRWVTSERARRARRAHNVNTPEGRA